MINTGKIKVILLVIFFLCFSHSLEAQLQWRSHSTKNEPNNLGIDLNYQIPQGFDRNSGTVFPYVLSEFDRITYNTSGDIETITYFTVATIPMLDVSGLLKTTNGAWIPEMVELFLDDFAKQLNGIRSYEILWFGGYPTLDVKLWQEQILPYVVFRDIDARIILLETKFIKLECGDVSTQVNKLEHSKNFQSLCVPFFNNISFKY
ncbi:MAG: hypothetical protein LBE38_07080 [Deltaproteobacteria bacterium]|nr:hypothetical protein [Deltaproteobacteria bacterium]